MHDCSRYKPQPVHLHRQIHSRIIPSSWSYEDSPCVVHGICLLRKRGSQFAGSSGYDHCRNWNDLVQQRLNEAWWKGASQPLASNNKTTKNRFCWTWWQSLIIYTGEITWAYEGRWFQESIIIIILVHHLRLEIQPSQF